MKELENERLTLKLDDGLRLVDGEYQTCWWATAGGGTEFFSNDESDFHQLVGDWVWVHIRELGTDPINEDADYESVFESVMDTQIRVMVNVLEPRLAALIKEQKVPIELVKKLERMKEKIKVKQLLRSIYENQETAEWQEEVRAEDIH